MENQNESKAMENVEQSDDHPEDIFDLEEIEIEELAIDGICGVY